MFDTTVAGENGQGDWNQGEWNQGEDEWGPRRRWRRRRRWASYDDDEFAPGGAEFEDEFEGEDEDAGEEQFLPIVAAGLKLLPAILGSLGGGKEAEYEEGEEGEDEERFIGNLLKRFLGEAEYEEEVLLSPAQEAELAGRLLEVSGEDELKQVLGKIVDVVGSAMQGVRNAARSPQGRALVEAMTPVARTVVPGTGLSPGEVFETETSGMSQEQEVFESARQAVRLTAAAAQNVASAPPGVPPEVVGELGIIRAASRLARPLFGRALRAFSPLARRALGIRRYGPRGGYRYGRPYRRSYGGYRGPRYWGGYRGPRYGGYRYPYGYPPPSGYVEGPPEPMGPPPATFPAPSPEPPGPPQPGYRWVAVPIGAPLPAVVPSDPAPSGQSAPPDGPPSPGQPAQGEWGQGEWGQGEWGQGEWGQGEWGQGEWGQGEYQPGGYGQGAGEGPGMNGPDGDGQAGRWVRRRGKIVVLGA